MIRLRILSLRRRRGRLLLACIPSLLALRPPAVIRLHPEFHGRFRSRLRSNFGLERVVDFARVEIVLQMPVRSSQVRAVTAGAAARLNPDIARDDRARRGALVMVNVPDCNRHRLRRIHKRARRAKPTTSRNARPAPAGRVVFPGRVQRLRVEMVQTCVRRAADHGSLQRRIARNINIKTAAPGIQTGLRGFCRAIGVRYRLAGNIG